MTLIKRISLLNLSNLFFFKAFLKIFNHLTKIVNTLVIVLLKTKKYIREEYFV